MLRESPRVIVVGGQCRRAGKTAFAADVIRSFAECDWLAVKITHHHAEESGTENYVFQAETDRSGDSDTSRFLAAGAERAFLLRIRPGHFAEALPELNALADGAQNVIIESTAALNYLYPALAILVLDPRRGEFKISARRMLGLADAFVLRSPLFGRSWPGVSAATIRTKPCVLQPIGSPIPSAARRIIRRVLSPWR